MNNNIRHDVIAWNNRFPLDHWYRDKYKIPYLSAAHRESTFYAQYFEYHEELIYKEVVESKTNKKKISEYVPMIGNWWNGKVSSKKEINDWFSSPI